MLTALVSFDNSLDLAENRVVPIDLDVAWNDEPVIVKADHVRIRIGFDQLNRRCDTRHFALWSVGLLFLPVARHCIAKLVAQRRKRVGQPAASSKLDS